MVPKLKIRDDAYEEVAAHDKFDLPRSMPITWPLTFSSPPLDWCLKNAETKGERVAERREKGRLARGS